MKSLPRESESNQQSITNFKLGIDKPGNVVYFNNSGKTPVPISVQEAGQRALQRESHPWTLGDECTDEIRSLFSQIIHASPKDIAIVPSTAFAMSLEAQNLFRNVTYRTSRCTENNGNDPNKLKVLILQDEMASEVYVWQAFRDQIEFVIVTHPQSASGWTKLILQSLENEHITVCCVPQVHW
jgi:selenocysteine lyase/cysteine desulfurase